MHVNKFNPTASIYLHEQLMENAPHFQRSLAPIWMNAELCMLFCMHAIVMINLGQQKNKKVQETS